MHSTHLFATYAHEIGAGGGGHRQRGGDLPVHPPVPGRRGLPAAPHHPGADPMSPLKRRLGACGVYVGLLPYLGFASLPVLLDAAHLASDQRRDLRREPAELLGAAGGHAPALRDPPHPDRSSRPGSGTPCWCRWSRRRCRSWSAPPRRTGWCGSRSAARRRSASGSSSPTWCRRPSCSSPLSRVVTALGLSDSRLSLVVTYPTFIVPFCTWLLMSYFATIPKELEECAIVDGGPRAGRR